MNRLETIREYFFATVGTFITALGLVIFLIPSNIAAGGVSGLSIILNHFIPISVGVWMYILNGILFLIAFLTIGFDFSAKTIYCTFVLNFFVDFLDRFSIVPKYSGEDLFIVVFFGDILTALGMAITFSQNASTGGTDIIARIFNRYFGTSLGKTLLFVDFTIGALAGVSFNARTGMYSILAIIINGLSIDFIMRGLELSSEVFIISSKNKEIASFVLNKLERGATYIPAKGAYTGTDREVLMVVVKRRELNELIRYIRKLDPSAFVIIKEVRQVLGEGFKKIEKIF
ncbi:MAG: membrane protein [Thermotoga sp. 4484_232]|nr:MAG: membrane protein [Thermotoga sp. 4484_232]RKX40286.1 MAG: YitT family protein [Thermotogota bacterium]